MQTFGRSPIAWTRLLGVTCLAVVLWAGYHYLWPAHGVRDVYVGRCDARERIVVKSSAYSHPLDFVKGDATGYGLFLRISGQPSDVPIWDDAFSERELQVAFPTPYIGWDLVIDWNLVREKGGWRAPRLSGTAANLGIRPCAAGSARQPSANFRAPLGNLQSRRHPARNSNAAAHEYLSPAGHDQRDGIHKACRLPRSPPKGDQLSALTASCGFPIPEPGRLLSAAAGWHRAWNAALVRSSLRRTNTVAVWRYGSDEAAA